MAERKKLELELNKTVSLELLFDECVKGQSRYGDYFLYMVKDQSGVEYSLFAPEEVHEKLKDFRKGDRFSLTKEAGQNGKKIIIKFSVIKTESKQPESTNGNTNDNFYDLMLTSCRDAVKIQNELGGLMDAKSLAVTLFIARSKINGNSMQ
jgi:hypothetical protein